VEHRRAACVVLLAAAAAFGQVSPTPPCFAFNDAGVTAGPPVPVDVGGTTSVFFAAPGNYTINEISVFVQASNMNLGLAAALHATSAPNTVGPVIAQGTTQSTVSEYMTVVLNQAAALASGVQYAVVFSAFVLPSYPNAGAYLPTLGTEGTNPTLLACHVTCGTGFPALCGLQTPPGAQAAVRLRFRRYACGPGPLAAAYVLGGPCGPPLFLAPTLSVSAPPVLGTTVSVTFGKPWAFAATAALYWSLGANPAGAAILGGPCVLYLDQASLVQMQTLGLEPGWTGSLPVYPAAGVVTLPLAIPLSPALAGTLVSMQGIIADPPAPPGPLVVGGVAYSVTSGIQMFLGY